MSDLTISHSGGVAIVTMNRPAAKNALSDSMVGELIEAFDRLSRSSEVRAVVLTGAGTTFCSGGDVKDMVGRTRNFDERIADNLWRAGLASAMINSPKPVIAAVAGAAYGAGLSLALAADFRVISQSTRFVPGFANMALSGDFGISWSLVRLVGPAKARELFMLNPVLGAAEIASLGLATRVVADESLLDEALALAETLASGPSVAFAGAKRNLLAAERGSLEATLETEATSLARCAFTDDFAEAKQAFVEKRKPVFRGS